MDTVPLGLSVTECAIRRTMRRHGYLALGWICVALGLVGVFVPIMPTTIFILVAAWAFARSSPALHQWLRDHPHFGEPLVAWEQHRAMPRRAKRVALAMLALSYAITAAVLGPLAPGSIFAGVCIAAVAIFIARVPVLTDEPPSRAQLP
jgi:uncharacterized membrane protein YbaN (DUF454 family)